MNHLKVYCRNMYRTSKFSKIFQNLINWLGCAVKLQISLFSREFHEDKLGEKCYLSFPNLVLHRTQVFGLSFSILTMFWSLHSSLNNSCCIFCSYYL